MRKSINVFIALCTLLVVAPSALADDPLEALRTLGPPGGLRPGLPPLPGRRLPGGRITRQSSLTGDTTPSILESGRSPGSSIITGDDSTLLHPKPGSSLLQPSASSAPTPTGAGFPDQSKILSMPDGGDLSRKFLPGRHPGEQTRQGGLLPPGATMTRNDVDGSVTLSKDGYKFTRKDDGSSVFTRTNGLETEFKDGRIRMKQDGQYTGREIIK